MTDFIGNLFGARPPSTNGASKALAAKQAEQDEEAAEAAQRAILASRLAGRRRLTAFPRPGVKESLSA